MKISLRWQIFLWYALIIPLLIVVLVFIAQQVMVERLHTTGDHQLKERTEIVSSIIMSTGEISPEACEDLIEWLTEQQFVYVPAILRISDPGRNVLATFGDIPDPMVPTMDRQLRLPVIAEGRFETVRVKGEETLRLYTVPVYDPSSGEFIAMIQTGDSLAQLVAAEETLWPHVLLVGIVGSILALLVGFVILWRGFRPLDKILNRVQEIGGKDLSAGIPEERRAPELQQLAYALNSMLRRLDSAFRTREVFIAGVSHDLRTPLSVLQGQVDVMLMQPSLDEETKQSLKGMSKEIRRLSRMTNNLLLNAQLESTPVYTPGEVDLAELLDEVAREAQVLAEGLHLKVSIPEIIVIVGDYDLLKQMVLNVVDNAIKFTPKGGSVEFTLSQEEEYAVLRVSDTGRGMSPEQLAHIEKLFREADASREFGRRLAGLGLTIVKQIIDLHGGQVEIHSQEGIGTTVTMRLPLIPPPVVAE